MLHSNKDDIRGENLETRSNCDELKEKSPYTNCALITMAIRDSSS